MCIKDDKGFTAIDIAVSIIIITIFIAVIANLIVNIDLNSKNMDRKTVATSYAVQEIEKIRSKGYVNEYDAIEAEEYEEDIFDSLDNFTGYHKKVSIKDYSLVDNTRQKNFVKQIIVEISYNLGGKEKNVSISTYVAKK